MIQNRSNAILTIITGGDNPLVNPVLQYGLIITNEKINALSYYSGHIKPNCYDNVEPSLVEDPWFYHTDACLESGISETKFLGFLSSKLGTETVILGVDISKTMMFINEMSKRNGLFPSFSGKTVDLAVLVRSRYNLESYDLDSLLDLYKIPKINRNCAEGASKETLLLAKKLFTIQQNKTPNNGAKHESKSKSSKPR